MKLVSCDCSGPVPPGFASVISMHLIIYETCCLLAPTTLAAAMSSLRLGVRHEGTAAGLLPVDDCAFASASHHNQSVLSLQVALATLRAGAKGKKKKAAPKKPDKAKGKKGKATEPETSASVQVITSYAIGYNTDDVTGEYLLDLSVPSGCQVRLRPSSFARACNIPYGYDRFVEVYSER